MIGLKKKKTHVDNRGFGVWVEISIIIFLYCTWQIKYLYYFGEKSKMQPMSSSLGNDKF